MSGMTKVGLASLPLSEYNQFESEMALVDFKSMPTDERAMWEEVSAEVFDGSFKTDMIAIAVKFPMLEQCSGLSTPQCKTNYDNAFAWAILPCTDEDLPQ